MEAPPDRDVEELHRRTLYALYKHAVRFKQFHATYGPLSLILSPIVDFIGELSRKTSTLLGRNYDAERRFTYHIRRPVPVTIVTVTLVIVFKDLIQLSMHHWGSAVILPRERRYLCGKSP